jgi:peptidyl-prolyl cis-trans isomerase C
MKRIALTVLTLVLAGGALPFAALAEDKVVATVDGKPITEGDLAVAEGEIGSDMGTMPAPQKRTSLLEFLIDNQLFAEAAEKEKLDATPEFQTRLDYLKRRALRELYFEKAIKASVSDADARKIYDEQVKLLKPEEEVSARHILVDTEAEAKALKDKLDKGADFAQLAKENSKDPGSKDDGGSLGYFGRGQMVPQFEEIAFKLEKGQVSDPVKTQFGWHVIKLEDRRVKQPPAFEIVKDRIMQSLLLKKAQQDAVALRSNAKIEVIDPEIKKTVDDRNAMIQQQSQPKAVDTPKDAAKP